MSREHGCEREHESENETIVKIKIGAVIGLVGALVLFLLASNINQSNRITVVETNYPNISEKLILMDKKLDTLMGYNADSIVIKRHNNKE